MKGTLARLSHDPRLRSLPVKLVAVGALFRVGVALATLADSGHRLAPGFPRYEYNSRPGDAYAFYAAVRELLEVWQREAKIVLPVALLAIGIFAVVWRRSQSSPQRSAIRIVAACWALAAIATTLAHTIRYTGAGTIGWPLIWAVLLLPYRAVGLPLDPGIAFGVGLAISLVFIVAAIIGTYLLGREATGRVSIGVVASLLFAFWPLLVILLAGARGELNATWQVDVGLSLYSEPVSTALACLGLVLVIRRGGGSLSAAAAGALLGFDVAVRLSNVLILAIALVWLACRDRVRLLWAAGASAAFAPVVLAFWRQGYFNPGKSDTPSGSGVLPAHVFGLHYAHVAWTQSLLWRPPQLIVLVPLAVVGVVMMRRSVAALFWAAILATAAFYSVYVFTPLHPRFLFVVLPPLLVLWAAGGEGIAFALRSRVVGGGDRL